MGSEFPAAAPETRAQKRRWCKPSANLSSGGSGAIWLLLLPHYPFLILGPAAGFLKPAPMWHTFYLPIVLVATVRPAASGNDPCETAMDVASIVQPVDANGA